MSWFRIIEEDEATEEVKDIYKSEKVGKKVFKNFVFYCREDMNECNFM